MRLFVSQAVAVATVSLLSSIAGADMISIKSNGPSSTDLLGKYVGSITYAPLTATTATLTISLTNTNTLAEGGFITGMVFNIPGSDAAAAALLANANPASFLDTGSSESASPFGTFEAGAALGGSWLGGGSPNGGIAVGTTGTLVFNITTTGAAGISAASFLGTAESPGLVVRFKGFANGGSDKVPGTVLPAPSAGALAGMGLVFAGRRRRR